MKRQKEQRDLEKIRARCATETRVGVGWHGAVQVSKAKLWTVSTPRLARESHWWPWKEQLFMTWWIQPLGTTWEQTTNSSKLRSDLNMWRLYHENTHVHTWIKMQFLKGKWGYPSRGIDYRRVSCWTMEWTQPERVRWSLERVSDRRKALSYHMGGKERNWRWACVLGSSTTISVLILESRMCT